MERVSPHHGSIPGQKGTAESGIQSRRKQAVLVTVADLMDNLKGGPPARARLTEMSLILHDMAAKSRRS